MRAADQAHIYSILTNLEYVPPPFFGPYNSSKRFGGTVTLRSNQLTLIVLHLFKKKRGEPFYPPKTDLACDIQLDTHLEEVRII